MKLYKISQQMGNHQVQKGKKTFFNMSQAVDGMPHKQYCKIYEFCDDLNLHRKHWFIKTLQTHHFKQILNNITISWCQTLDLGIRRVSFWDNRQLDAIKLNPSHGQNRQYEQFASIQSLDEKNNFKVNLNDISLPLWACLIEIRVYSITISSIEAISWLNAPMLEIIHIFRSSITSTKPLQKVNLPSLRVVHIEGKNMVTHLNEIHRLKIKPENQNGSVYKTIFSLLNDGHPHLPFIHYYFKLEGFSFWILRRTCLKVTDRLSGWLRFRDKEKAEKLKAIMYEILNNNKNMDEPQKQEQETRQNDQIDPRTKKLRKMSKVIRTLGQLGLGLRQQRGKSRN